MRLAITPPFQPETCQVLETLALPVVAAAQFADLAVGRVVGDGLAASLTLMASAADNAAEVAAPRALVRAGGGAHVAHSLPGIRLPPIQPADFSGPSPPAAPRPYRLRLADPQARFLPFSARLQAPALDAAAWPGWAALASLQPAALRASARALLGDGVRWPLFGAPGRANPGGLAEIRCNLVARDADAPVPAWVLIGVEHQGRLIGLGLSGPRGAAVIHCPYPPLPADMPIPPPGFSWPIRIRAWSHRLPADRMPDLAAVLAQFDRQAQLFGSRNPDTPLPSQDLRPGQPLSLRTTRTAGNSELVIHA